ncbi:MAG: hypothetical protein WCK74_00025 [Gemmatimonadaceae bacterium]
MSIALTLMVAQPATAQPAPRSAGTTPFTLVVDRRFPIEVIEVRGIRELSDGRLIVLVREPRAILLLDSAGGSSRQIGRLGDGPGEYRSPAQIFALGNDSTLVIDGANRKWYLMARDRMVSLPSALEQWRLREFVMVHGADAQGNLLQMLGLIDRAAREVWQTSPEPQWARRSALLVRLPNGRIRTVDTLRGQYAVAVSRKLVVNQRAMFYFGITNPLQSYEQATLFPTGEIAIAHLAPYRIDWVSRDGSVRRGPVVPDAPVLVTAAVKQRYADDWKRNDDGTPVLRAKDFPPWPAVVPPFLASALVAGTDGLLYVTRSRSAVSKPLEIDVFDSTGRRIGTAKLPEGSRLLAVTPRGWYVAMGNENDEETLVRLKRTR